MNEFEQNVVDRAREWYYARRAEANGAPINWSDFNAEYLEEAVEELIAAEEEAIPEVIVFICF